MIISAKEEEKLKKRLLRVVKINKRIDLNRVPGHVAFIMDGNGRWAAARGMPRNYGHQRGYGAMVGVLRRCVQLGIGVVSVYAFSTENWKRPQDELDEIFRIVRENMDRDAEEFIAMGVKVVASGDITKFPKDLQDKLVEVIDRTRDGTKCVLNMCINYGGRADIVQAVNEIINTGKKSITEAEFGGYLYNSDLPDPDLVVRTSGEQRVSNFMLWQMSYSEFLFVDWHWPDMDARKVDKCILNYQGRNRRFGSISK
ncbi:MAG: polyprenyl diphosphate synthase [Firmicutes bacterium]|nr:polyprenyl diphosphate synthase [Bacillota bacterium]